MEKISERHAAELIDIYASTILRWRKKGLIPDNLFEIKKYISGNNRVFYLKKEFLEWYENQKFLFNQ